jgi:ABC-2 type transport system permease protein
MAVEREPVYDLVHRLTLGFTILFPVTFASNIMVDPATMPEWLAVFVNVNPVSLMTTALRGLMSGTASPGMIGQALIAPVLLTAALAPVTLVLYRRK